MREQALNFDPKALVYHHKPCSASFLAKCSKDAGTEDKILELLYRQVQISLENLLSIRSFSHVHEASHQKIPLQAKAII